MAERTNPYSQHFRCMPRLFQNSVRNDIFMYLLDEHLQQLHQKQGSPAITISNRVIGEKAGVNRNIVPSHLKALHELHLINLQKRSCTIDTNFLIGIVSLFNEQPNNEGYRKVRSAFLAGDIAKLEKLGLKKSKNGDKELLSLEGGIEVAQMCATLSISEPDAQMCAKWPKCVPSGTDVCHSKDAYMCASWPTSVPLGTHIGHLKTVFDTPENLYRAVANNFSESEAQICAKKFANLVFDAQMCATEEGKNELLGLMAQLFTEIVVLGGTDLGTQVAQMCALGGTDIGHRNKYNKENKKRNIQSEALVKERETLSEDEAEMNEDEDEEFFSDFGKPLEVIELKTDNPVLELSGTPSKRHALSYPMFSVEDVDRIVNDLEYASTNSLKLFINTVWWLLSDYVIDSEPDEEDFSESINIEGHGFPVEDFQKEVLEVAYEEVKGYMEKGCIETDDGKFISVKFTEMFPVDLLGSIFKWEKKALRHDETVYKISKTGIYDISTEKIERACQPETREEKRAAIQDSLQYMTKIYLVESEKLTPIEKVAAKCIEDFLIPEKTDSGAFRFSLNKESESISEEGAIVRNSWRMLKVQIKNAGYTEQEFLSCLLNSKAPNQYEQLTIQPCMFFADGIRTLNKLHGHESIIDNLSIESLK